MPAPPGLDPAHQHARQVHLDRRLLDRAHPPSVAVDDRGLEGLAAQLRHPQRYLARTRVPLALLAACPQIPASLGPLVALGVAQPIGLRIEQGVQRLLNSATHDPAQMVLDPLLVDPNHIDRNDVPLSSPIGGSSFGLVLANPPYQEPPPPALGARFSTSSQREQWRELVEAKVAQPIGIERRVAGHIVMVPGQLPDVGKDLVGPSYP